MKKSLLLLFIVFGVTAYGESKKHSKSSTVNRLHNKALTTQNASNNGQIPIVAWIGVPEIKGTPERYQEFKDAGFTTSYWPFLSADAVEAALDVAQKAGIKIFISCPELERTPEIIVKRFMNHPANAGYFVNDEPPTSRFPRVISLVKRIKAIDNKHICYVNLLPNVATGPQLGAINYQDYLNRYINQVPSDILSFDHYPIIGNTRQSVTQNWYQNLEMVSTASRKYNKPFWAFALSVAFTPHPVATLGSLKLQVFSDLAYGAQGIQYFTYWTPAVSPGGPNFDNAIIARDGKKTNVYGEVQQVNSEIKSLSGVFAGAKLISVTHTGNTIPSGTRPFKILPKTISMLKTDGMGAIVSVLLNNDKTYLVIVNRDFTAPMTLTIKCKAGVSMISKDGSSTPQNQNTNSVTVDPGDVAIYTWSHT